MLEHLAEGRSMQVAPLRRGSTVPGTERSPEQRFRDLACGMQAVCSRMGVAGCTSGANQGAVQGHLVGAASS
eukprot:1993358-Alexandrium_andersonii.AAC.1